MLLIINVTQFGAKIGDSEAEELLLELINWIRDPDYDYDPRDTFGQPHMFPLIKTSQDEEMDNIWNCNEWKIDVDCELVALAARVLLVEGIIPKGSLKILAEGIDMELDDNGRTKHYHSSLDVSTNLLSRLLMH